MEIVKEYENGKSATQISKETGVSLYKVLKLLKQNGANVYNKQNETNWVVDDFVKLYNEGNSLTDISKKLDINVSIISNALKKINFKVINKQNVTKFNENIFDVIDSEEKAYWLGFIYADGYVSKKRNSFELSLGLKDTEHLTLFAKFMSHENNVKVDSFRCRFSVVNKHLKQKLIELGVVPNKSLILTFPTLEQISSNLINHFIRGYFDGDGCILTKETSQVKLRVSLLGTNSFLIDLLKIIGIDKKVHKSKSEAYYFVLGIKDSEFFLNYIYNNGSIFLERKNRLYTNYEKYRKILGDSK